MFWDEDRIKNLERDVRILNGDAEYWTKGADLALTAYRTSHPEIVNLIRATVKKIDIEAGGAEAQRHMLEKFEQQDRDNAMKPEYV